MTWRIIHNPAAGKPRDVGPRLRRALEAHNVLHETVVSQSPADVRRLVDAAVGDGVRRFAAVGGDGTAHLVLNALMNHGWESPPTLAIIPAGTGSDFIRTFALPRTVEGGVEVMAGEQLYRCDIGVIEGAFGRRYFLNACNAGVAAASVARAERLPQRLGGLRYTAAFWLALWRFRPGPVAVDLGQRTLSGDAMNVVVANGQFFGGGLNVAPRAALTDGLLDVQLFLGPRRRAFSIMPRVVKGLHLKHPAVRSGRGAAIAVDVPTHWPIEADGETIGTGPVQIEVVPGAIDFAI